MTDSQNPTPTDPVTSHSDTTNAATPDGTNPSVARPSESTPIEATGSEPSTAPSKSAEAEAAPSAASPSGAATASPGPYRPSGTRRILIGSERDEAENSDMKAAVAAAGKAQTPTRPDAGGAPGGSSGGPIRVAPPNLRQKDDDIEAELAATLGGELGQPEGSTSVADLMKSDSAPKAREYGDREKVEATVSRIHNDEVFFDLRGRHSGVAPLRAFTTPPEVGQTVTVQIGTYNDEEGLYAVGMPGSAVDVEDWDELEVGQVVEAKVVGTSTGGLEVRVGTIKGFMPASQISLNRVESFGEFVNTKIKAIVAEVNPGRKRLIVSARRILEQEQEENRRKQLETLEVGQEIEGLVSRLMDFGAFVDLGGGVDGLVHISKLSWDNVEKPSDVVQVGERVKVRVERIVKETGKISLSLRDLQENPWDRVEEKYPVGTVVTGPVTRVMDFGAFVKLEPGVEGLIHVSELAHHRVMQVRNYARPGQDLEVKVLSVDRGAQRISLSLKALQEAPPEKKTGKKEEELPEAVPSVKKRETPLKGGTESSTGGQKFGLKW